MMYVATCPLRIALFGGSTDNPYFVEKYGSGAVINFTSNLKTYITLHEDKLGFNREGRKYIVNYSRREEVDTIDEIQNEIIRNPLKHFNCPPLSITMKVMLIHKVVDSHHHPHIRLHLLRQSLCLMDLDP